MVHLPLACTSSSQKLNSIQFNYYLFIYFWKSNEIGGLGLDAHSFSSTSSISPDILDHTFLKKTLCMYEQKRWKSPIEQSNSQTSTTLFQSHHSLQSHCPPNKNSGDTFILIIITDLDHSQPTQSVTWIDLLEEPHYPQSIHLTHPSHRLSSKSRTSQESRNGLWRNSWRKAIEWFTLIKNNQMPDEKDQKRKKESQSMVSKSASWDQMMRLRLRSRWTWLGSETRAEQVMWF